jgi:hypothetical protein
MSGNSVVRVIAIAAALLGLSACLYSPDIPTRAIYYNRSVASATNQILVLNIMRASDREPRYFTRVGTDSAQNGVSGAFTATLPFLDVTKGNAGVSGAGSSANTFTLENLDDKKYQDGAMQPVAASTLRDLWSQGIQSDILGLLFVNSISIPKAELPILREAVDTFCADMRHYQKFCGTGDSLVASEPLANGWKASACLDPTSVPTDRRGGVDYAVYFNDPAVEDTAGAYHPELCFQIVLRDLLALGLHLEKRKTATEVDSHASAAMLANSTFRTELLKEGLIVTPDGKVKKEGSEIVMAFDPSATAFIRLHNNFRAVVMQCIVYAARKVEPETSAHCPPARGLKESEAAWHARVDAAERDYENLVTTDETKARPVSLGELQIGIDVRSFESVVYYLGEIVRGSRGDGVAGSPPYIVRVLGRQPSDPEHRSHYEETLFDLRRGSPEHSAALVVRDDYGNSNWIPAFCYVPSPPRPDATEAARSCSSEYPDHDTMTVLALVNQVWGLQKEPSTAPQPILTLGG